MRSYNRRFICLPYMEVFELRYRWTRGGKEENVLSLSPQSYALQLLTMPTELSLLTQTSNVLRIKFFCLTSLPYKRKSLENCESGGLEGVVSMHLSMLLVWPLEILVNYRAVILTCNCFI
jgi:hypothetical protein